MVLPEAAVLAFGWRDELLLHHPRLSGRDVVHEIAVHENAHVRVIHRILNSDVEDAVLSPREIVKAGRDVRAVAEFHRAAFVPAQDVGNGKRIARERCGCQKPEQKPAECHENRSASVFISSLI